MTRATGRPTPENLTPLEMEVMDIAWSLRRMSVRDIHEIISKKRYLPYTTISAVMKNLTEKKLLKQARKGRLYIYKVLVDRETFAAAAIRSVVSNILKGDASSLVAYFAAKNPPAGT